MNKKKRLVKRCEEKGKRRSKEHGNTWKGRDYN